MHLLDKPLNLRKARACNRLKVVDAQLPDRPLAGLFNLNPRNCRLIANQRRIPKDRSSWDVDRWDSNHKPLGLTGQGAQPLANPLHQGGPTEQEERDVCAKPKRDLVE